MFHRIYRFTMKQWKWNFMLGFVIHALIVWDHAKCQLILDRSVQCHSNEMRVYFEFGGPFTGVVYAQGFYKSTTCRWDGDGTRTLVATIPLNANPGRNPYCGVQMREENGECTVTLLISPVRGLLVEGMEGLTVRCLYHIGDVTLTLPGSGLTGAGLVINSKSQTGGVVTGSGGSPFLQMTIRNGHGVNGDIIQSAEVGQRITLDVAMRDTAVYDFRVHDCYAHDGTNSPEATIGIVDSSGCAMPLTRAVENQVFMTHSDPSTGAKHVYIHMYGFQFTTSQLVYFECQVKPCLQACDAPQCTRALSRVRRRPEKIEKVGTLEKLPHPSEDENYNLTAVIRIEPQSLEAVIPVARDTGTIVRTGQIYPEICLHTDAAIGVLVVFVLVCLISVLIALFLCHRAKRDNTNCNNKPTVTSYYTSSSGSSAPVTTSPSPQVYARRLGSQLRYSLSSGLTRS